MLQLGGNVTDGHGGQGGRRGPVGKTQPLCGYLGHRGGGCLRGSYVRCGRASGGHSPGGRSRALQGSAAPEVAKQQ